MRNLQKTELNLKLHIIGHLNNPISLIVDLKSDKRTQLDFLPQENVYSIFICSKILNKTCVYKSKDLGLALKEYWELIGEEYE